MHTIKFRNERLTVEKAQYNNGKIALQLIDEEGFPYMKATVNLPIQANKLEDDETFIKNYAENEGILGALVEQGIVEETGTTIDTGFTHVHVVRVLI